MPDPQQQQQQVGPQELTSLAPPRGESSEGPQCDFRGNRLPTSLRNWHLLLRTPEKGEGIPEPGLYWGTFQQLKDICLPGRKLPQQGYGYRKIETEEAARKEWHDQGHRRPIPRFSL